MKVEGVITNFVSAAEFTLGAQVVQTNQDTVFENGTAEDLGLNVMVEVKDLPTDIERTILVADKVSFEED